MCAPRSLWERSEIFQVAGSCVFTLQPPGGRPDQSSKQTEPQTIFLSLVWMPDYSFKGDIRRVSMLQYFTHSWSTPVLHVKNVQGSWLHSFRHSHSYFLLCTPSPHFSALVLLSAAIDLWSSAPSAAVAAAGAHGHITHTSSSSEIFVNIFSFFINITLLLRGQGPVRPVSYESQTA